MKPSYTKHATVLLFWAATACGAAVAGVQRPHEPSSMSIISEARRAAKKAIDGSYPSSPPSPSSIVPGSLLPRLHRSRPVKLAAEPSGTQTLVLLPQLFAGDDNTAGVAKLDLHMVDATTAAPGQQQRHCSMGSSSRLVKRSRKRVLTWEEIVDRRRERNRARYRRLKDAAEGKLPPVKQSDSSAAATGSGGTAAEKAKSATDTAAKAKSKAADGGDGVAKRKRRKTQSGAAAEAAAADGGKQTAKTEPKKDTNKETKEETKETNKAATKTPKKAARQKAVAAKGATGGRGNVADAAARVAKAQEQLGRYRAQSRQLLQTVRDASHKRVAPHYLDAAEQRMFWRLHAGVAEYRRANRLLGAFGRTPAERAAAGAPADLLQAWRRGKRATGWMWVLGREVARRMGRLGGPDALPDARWRWLRQHWDRIDADWDNLGRDEKGNGDDGEWGMSAFFIFSFFLSCKRKSGWGLALLMPGNLARLRYDDGTSIAS